MEQRIADFEARNGVRFSWNTLPMDAAGASKLHIPIAAMLTPFKDIEELPLISKMPVICNKCSCILSHTSHITTTSWKCAFCHSENTFDRNESNLIQNGVRPAETLPQFATVEYVFPSRSGPTHPIFLFVIDTAISTDELVALKNSITETVMLLPPESVIGLITFGRHIRFHELTGYTPRSFVFDGDITPTRELLVSALNLDTDALRVAAAAAAAAAASTGASEQKSTTPSAHAHTSAAAAAAAPRRFLAAVQDCEAAFTAAVAALTPDPFPYNSATERPARATGAAIAAALALLDEPQLHDRPSRVMVFTGGVCTTAPGCCAGRDLSTPIRSHHDLVRRTQGAAYVKPATEFYEKLAKGARDRGVVIDLFVACLDQVGLLEMQSLANNTGGHVVLDDSFTRGTFRGSLACLFATDDNGNLQMAFGAQVHVMTSSELQIVGMIGPGASLEKSAPNVAQSNPLGLGVGGTYSWYLGGLDSTTTLAIYFNVTKAEAIVEGEHGASQIQFCTRFRLANGELHNRVTTVSRTHANTQRGNGFEALIAGFDQETALAVVARWVVFKSLTEPIPKVHAWLDKLIISFFTVFSKFEPMNVRSFAVPPQIRFLSSFFFYLRRSQFLQYMNNSPDETTFFRSALLHEMVSNIILMVQPSLLSYSIEEPCKAVALDMAACRPTVILVLDTFFHVVIWYGSSINYWRSTGVHLDPQQEHFARLLRAPANDCRESLMTRFPTPRFIECVEGGSQSRFLIAKLNPAKKPAAGTNKAGAPGEDAEIGPDGLVQRRVFSDDGSLKEFNDMIKSVVVSKGAPKTFSSARVGAMSSLFRMSSEHPSLFEASHPDDAKYEASVTPSEPARHPTKRLPPPSQTRTGDESDDEASEPPLRNTAANPDTPVSHASAEATPSSSARGSGIFSRLYNAPTASSLARGTNDKATSGDRNTPTQQQQQRDGGSSRRASLPRAGTPGGSGVTPLASGVASDADEKRRHSSGGVAIPSPFSTTTAGGAGASKPPRPSPSVSSGALPGFMGPKGSAKNVVAVRPRADSETTERERAANQQQRLTPTMPTAPLAFMRPTASSARAAAASGSAGASPAASPPHSGATSPSFTPRHDSGSKNSGTMHGRAPDCSRWAGRRVSPLHTRARAAFRSERAPLDSHDGDEGMQSPQGRGGRLQRQRGQSSGQRRYSSDESGSGGGSDISDSNRDGCGTMCSQSAVGAFAKPIKGVLTVVVFGASGDLAARKTYPALAGLAQRGLLPQSLVVVGVARTKMEDEEFRKKIGDNLPKPQTPEASEAQKSFLSHCYYRAGGYDDPDAFAALATAIDGLEAEAGGEEAGKDVTRLLYLAVPPDVFAPIADLSNKFLRPNRPATTSAASPAGGSKKGRLHVIVEKPFGHDLASARALNASLRAGFSEREIFRIDHYLAKEMAQNLTVLRFANRVFEPLWNNQHIQSVTIAFKEDIGIGSRSGYFDRHGCILDVLQNHVLQLLALTAMEPPVTLAAEDVRDEKVKLLRAVGQIDIDEVVVGQYIASKGYSPSKGDNPEDGDSSKAEPTKDDKSKVDKSKGDASKGESPAPGCAYRDEPGVPATSTTETFAAAVLRIENSRWAGVPFILKCGKGLNEGKTEIRIQFKRPENALFQDLPMNELVIKVKPRDSVYLKLCSKRPGLSGSIAVTELDFTVEDRFPCESRQSVDAYERLIFDVTHGDRSLFVRNDELMQSWRIVTPLVKAVRDAVSGQTELAPDTSANGNGNTGGSRRRSKGSSGKLRLIGYHRGSRGPAAADALATRVGFETSAGTYSWAPPEVRAAAAAEVEAKAGTAGGK